jgi:hypothetical protein
VLIAREIAEDLAHDPPRLVDQDFRIAAFDSL